MLFSISVDRRAASNVAKPSLTSKLSLEAELLKKNEFFLTNALYEALAVLIDNHK